MEDLMTTNTTAVPTRTSGLALKAALAGFLVYAAAVGTGIALDLGAKRSEDGQSASDLLITTAIALVGLAIATWTGTRALRREPSRVARTALVLGIVAALTLVAFWAGWAHIFGAVAVVLAVEYRRRVGSYGGLAGAGLGLGCVAIAVGTFMCLFG
jgi:hypothetical protein